MYDLNSDGLTDIKRAFPWAKQKFSRVALVGLVDGSNTTFHARHFPLQEVSVYNAVGSGLGYDSVDEEAGRISLSVAPSSTAYADYVMVERTDDELKDILQVGFDEMERRWSRGWALSTSGDAVNVVDSTGADPSVHGTTLFSASRAYIGILMLCARYTYLQQQGEYAAIHGLSYRQEGGFSADNRSRAPQIQSALTALDRRINRSIETVMAGLNPTELGDYLKPLKSDTYKGVFRWQGRGDQATDNSLLDDL